ncbi:vegetative cell wall protein gp1-like [Pimephales promelas]|uniref:vegetative cell wall protein gp1-like n=1 Tax=Pimephales promelas TaxID=90988 RepID=UPI001955C6C3|nr:vegetative cell wall protein gp1-like [Pimephales promelas]
MVFGKLFGCFAHFLHRRKTPPREQQYAEQGVAAGHSREDGEKKRKKRERKIKRPEVKPLRSPITSSFLKPLEGELPMLPSVSGHLALPRFKPLPAVTKPSVYPEKPVPAPEDELTLPYSPLPPQVDSPKPSVAPSCPDEVVVFRHSSSKMHPFAVPPRPTPAPEDELSLPFSPLPLQGDLPKLSAGPSCPDEVVSLRLSSSQMHPFAVPSRPTPVPDALFSIRHSSTQVRPAKPQMVPLAVPPRPTPAPDELFSIRCPSSQVRPPKGLPLSPSHAPDDVVALRRPPSRKPPLFPSSPFETPPQLFILVDIEDEENVYVEDTGKSILASDLQSECSLTPTEAEIKPRKMIAWLEKDSEVQEEAWPSEVEEIKRFKEEDHHNEMGDSKAIQGYSDEASRIDEHMRRLFCVASPDGPKNETQHKVNVQKCKRKVPLFLFNWLEEKAKKREEKERIKEAKRRD